LLILGIDARIRQLRKIIEYSANSDRPNEQFVKNLSASIEELQELITMRENL
jgi:hypothetical protein